jgi:hypothetical protein
MNPSPASAARRRAWIPVAVCLALSGPATAQEPRLVYAAQQEPAPAVVAAPVATNLESCLSVALSQQPALAAARASLAAAESGRRGIDSLPRFAVLFSPDVPIRRQQACIGVGIAAAGLQQAEWETRYAVARTYYSVLFAGRSAGWSTASSSS